MTSLEQSGFFGIKHSNRDFTDINSWGKNQFNSSDEPAPTVRGVNRPVPKGYPGHSGDPVAVTEDLRPLTTLERARLQTFPEDYKWIGSKTKIEQMVGNAVPVKLAEFVADRIIEYHCSPQRAYKQLQLNL